MLGNADRKDSESIYRQFSFFRRQENNILLLLTWSSTYHGQPLEVLSNWVKSKERLDLYQRPSKDLSLQQIAEGFALNLAALLCRERLLPLDRKDKERIIEASFLIDLNTIIDSQNINNKRTIFEQMIMSLMRVLSLLRAARTYFTFLRNFLTKKYLYWSH